MSATDYRRGDTVHWNHPDVDYDMYVVATSGDGALVTTDSWARIPARELTLVEPVEDKYDRLVEQVAMRNKRVPHA